MSDERHIAVFIRAAEGGYSYARFYAWRFS
jgi:hypothetical protein